MGNAGFAGRGERRLAGPCVGKTLDGIEVEGEARAQLERQAEETLEELMAGRAAPGAVPPAMIVALAMAVDLGVRVIVVLCEVERVAAVANQLRAVDWPLVYASSEPQAWETDLAHIRKHVAGRGVIIACARNARHLDQVRVLIERIDGGTYPALVVDEQPEAMVSARTQARLAELRRLLRRATLRG